MPVLNMYMLYNYYTCTCNQLITFLFSLRPIVQCQYCTCTCYIIIIIHVHACTHVHVYTSTYR